MRIGRVGVDAAAHAEGEGHAVLRRGFRIFGEGVPRPRILLRVVLLLRRIHRLQVEAVLLEQPGRARDLIRHAAQQLTAIGELDRL